jgi:hypothetical protein
MLWKNLARVITNYTINNPGHAGVLELKRQANAAGKPVSVFLQDMDVRNVGALRDCMFDAFPKPLKKGELVADLNPRGQWRVEAKEEA